MHATHHCAPSWHLPLFRPYCSTIALFFAVHIFAHRGHTRRNPESTFPLSVNSSRFLLPCVRSRGKIHPWCYSQSPVSQFSRFVHRFLNNFTAVICDFQSHCSHYWFLHIPPLFFEAGCVLLCSCKHIFPRWWFSLIFLHEFAHALQMSARTGKNQRVFPRRFRIAPVSADLRGLFLEISSVD